VRIAFLAAAAAVELLAGTEEALTPTQKEGLALFIDTGRAGSGSTSAATAIIRSA